MNRLVPAIIDAQQIISAAPQGLPAIVFTRRPASGRVARLCAVGDIGFHGRARVEGDHHGYPRLFEAIAPVLRSADVVFGNLECTLIDTSPVAGVLAGDSKAAGALSEAGFTLLNLANNHVYDYGADGLTSTMDAIQTAGVSILGAGATVKAARQLVYTQAHGLRIGWLGCAHTNKAQSDAGPRYWEFDEEALLTSIRQSRRKAHVLAVSIHIGYLYLDVPSPAHKAMAEKCVSEGADLVLMHHAHVLQGVQLVGHNGVVCYNLGNFLFDSSGGYVQIDTALKRRLSGAVFAFEIDTDGVCLAAALPTYVDDDFTVQWTLNPRGEETLHHLAEISRHIESDVASVFYQQRADRNVGPAFKVLWFHLRHGNWAILAGLLKRIRLRNVLMALRWIGGRCCRVLRR